MTNAAQSLAFEGGVPHRLLFLSHTHAFGPFRVGSHHYARTLARNGFDVVHVTTPISLAHRLTGRVSRAASASVPRGRYLDADGVTHLVPRTGLPLPLGLFRVKRELERHNINPTFDIVLIDQPLLWDDSIRTLGRHLIYRPTDLYPAGIKNRAEQEIVAAADGVVATSLKVLTGLGSLSVPAIVLENGVDAPHFASVDTGSRPMVCVYVGALDGRFDWNQVDAWARSNPTVRFVVAGPSPAPPSKVPTNVELLGPVSYDALPELLGSARVGLLPLSDDPSNSGRSPMKLHEYLAAGLSVVARETPVIHTNAQAGIFTYSGRQDADSALENALSVHTPNTAGARHAAAESWDAKTESLVAFFRKLS